MTISDKTRQDNYYREYVPYSVPKRVTSRGNPFGYRSRHIRFTTRKRIGKHIGLRIGLRIGKQIGLRIGKQIGLRIGKQIGLRIGVEKSFINYDNK